MDSLILDNAPLVRCTKPGDCLKIKEDTEDGRKKKVTYEVTDVYHYMVRALSLNRKRRRCFSYGDLVIMGKEYQSELPGIKGN